jgi:hypothetical protein
MTSWLPLTEVEGLRITRAARRLIRLNPLLALLFIAGPVAVMWLATKGGEKAAILAVFLPFGLVSLLAALLLSGFLLGLGLSAAAPRFENLDSQIRTAAISPCDAFLGTTALPLSIAWIALAVPIYDFGLSLFTTVKLSPASAWAFLLMAAQLVACIAGASIYELLRVRPSLAGLAASLIALLSLVLAAVLMPQGLGQIAHGPTPPVHALPLPLAFAGLIASALVAAVAWISLGARPARRPVTRERSRSRSIPGSLPNAIATWLTLTTIRDRRVRVVLLLGLGSGLAMVGATILLAGRSAEALAPLAAILLIQTAAGGPLALSSDLAGGGWLWRSLPLSTVTIGSSWWLAVTAATLLLNLVVIAPVFAVLNMEAYPFVLGAALLAAPIPAAVGRLLPFRHDALARQLGVLGLQLAFFLTPLAALGLLAQHVVNPLVAIPVLIAVLVSTFAISTRAAWREA